MNYIWQKLSIFLEGKSKAIRLMIFLIAFIFIGNTLINNWQYEKQKERELVQMQHELAEKQRKIIIDQEKRTQELINKKQEIENKIKSYHPYGELFIKYLNKIIYANKFDRRDIFDEYKKSICGLSRSFNEWPLTVEWTKIDSSGMAVVGFETFEYELPEVINYKELETYMSPKMRITVYSTMNEYDLPLYEKGYNDLSKGSYLFDKIKLLKKGDQVLVSGKFMDGIGCIETGIYNEHALKYGHFKFHAYIKEINKI